LRNEKEKNNNPKKYMKTRTFCFRFSTTTSASVPEREVCHNSHKKHSAGMTEVQPAEAKNQRFGQLSCNQKEDNKSCNLWEEQLLQRTNAENKSYLVGCIIT
jgi:hypothetical protein